MPSLHETQQNRQHMREALLQNHRDGILQSGAVLPPVRELAKRYGLSATMAHGVLREMEKEGLVQLRRGSGAYMGHLPERARSTFGAIFSEDITYLEHLRMVREGFESEIARRVGTSVSLTPETIGLESMLDDVAEGQLAMAGALFLPSYSAERHTKGEKLVRGLGRIPFIVHDIGTYSHQENLTDLTYDTIRFDDFDGGRQAARHLWERGYQRVAFVGMHSKENSRSEFLWSLRRQQGFVSALNELGGIADTFNPGIEPETTDAHGGQERATQSAIEQLIPLLRNGAVKAVVCVNHLALRGMIQAVRDHKLTESQWPTLIAFDDLSRDEHLLSVLRLPWSELGRIAACALWERAFGTHDQRNAPSREILVPMRLIARPTNKKTFPTMAVAAAVMPQL